LAIAKFIFILFSFVFCAGLVGSDVICAPGESAYSVRLVHVVSQPRTSPTRNQPCSELPSSHPHHLCQCGHTAQIAPPEVGIVDLLLQPAIAIHNSNPVEFVSASTPAPLYRPPIA
jgi:hypothetical protein